MLDPYHILDLTPDADLFTCRRAHQKLRALYTFGAAATAGLLDDDERQAYLDRLDQALETILTRQELFTRPDPAHIKELDLTTPPDPQEAPGAYLRWMRKTAGVTLQEIAERTKISASRIEAIEQELEKQLAAVYLRGCVHTIASVLNIRNPRQIADLYLRKTRECDSVC